MANDVIENHENVAIVASGNPLPSRCLHQAIMMMFDSPVLGAVMKANVPAAGQRGRSALTKVNPVSSTKRETVNEQTNGVNRSVSAGDHRGDRRDMSPTYTGNKKHSARGNTTRKDVSTRKR
jgi:hypothetical protein